MSANRAPDKNRPWLRGMGVLAAAVLLPKCLLCLAGYLAVGTGLMRAAPELCGAAERASSGDGGLAMAGSVLLAATWLLTRNRRMVSDSNRLAR